MMQLSRKMEAKKMAKKRAAAKKKMKASPVQAEPSSVMKQQSSRARVKKLKTILFDESEVHEFRADIELGPGVEQTLDGIELGAQKADGHLTYDDVEMAALEMAEKRWPREFYPKMAVKWLWVKDEKEWRPVVREGDEEGRKWCREVNGIEKWLELPEARFELTEEFKMFLALGEAGVVDPEADEFDAEKMREVLDAMKAIAKGRKQ